MISKIFERNIAYRVRKIGGQIFLIGENTYYELNEVAFEIWNCIENEKSIEDIVSYVGKEFDVDDKILVKDVYEFINVMENNNVIKVIGDEQ